MASCSSQCSKIIKVAGEKGFCNLGNLNLVSECLDKEGNSGLAKASGNWFPKIFLLGSGASSLFLCSPQPCSTLHTSGL